MPWTGHNPTPPPARPGFTVSILEQICPMIWRIDPYDTCENFAATGNISFATRNLVLLHANGYTTISQNSTVLGLRS
jgi:hypothetical protein